jgi:hypothetical protein
VSWTLRPEKPLLDRLSLHARAVRVPRFGGGGGGGVGEAAGDLEIVAPYPDDFAHALKQLRRWSGLAQ